MAGKKQTEVQTPTGFAFDKELFKRSVLYNIKTLYRKTLEEASPQQLFQAVAYAIKDAVVDNWLETQKQFDKQDPKTVYYMSMEFLMGRALGNNIINLKAYEPVSQALEELGVDLNVVEDQEPDAALGNGGLGRLAACFLDSLATRDMRHTDAGSVINTVCSNRRSVTVIRSKFPITGLRTAILLNYVVPNMPRSLNSAAGWM